MISLKQGIFSVNLLIFLTSLVIVVGMTACSGKASNATDSNSSSAGIIEKEQNRAKEAQEAPSINTPTPYVSKFAAEEAQIISGNCGKDAVWSYDTESKLLQITGTGVVDQIIKKSEEYVSESGSKKRYQVKEIKVGEGITALNGHWLFHNVVKAKEAEEIQLSLPDSLEKIGVGSFISGDSEDEYIRHIHLPHKVRYIEGGAFWGYGDIAQPYIYSYKDDVKQITKKYKKKLEITVDSKNPYYTVKDGVLFTKDVNTLVYYPTEKTDKVYHIPKSVTRIKALAFARNSFLKKIVLPDGIKEIGAGAFFDDNRLAKINLEQAKKVKRICDFNGKKYGISGNSGVPEGIAVEVLLNDDEHYDDPKESKKYAYSLGTFAGTKLKSIQFPDRLKSVSYNTFKNCFHLRKVFIGKSFAEEINPDITGDNKGFLLPVYPSIMEIKVSAGNAHYQVKNHVLYSKDGKIVYGILKTFCDSTLILDKRVSKIASRAFAGAAERKPRKVRVLGDLKQISREAFATSSIESMEVYGNVNTIGIDAFFMCYGLKEFICHGTVKHIGAQAFYYAANLRKISLGKNIKSIGKDAFEGCEGVKKPRVKKK